MANKATVTITTPVVARTSFIDGAVTLRISVRTSLRKLADWSHHPRTLFPPLSSEPLAAMDLLVATFAILPFVLLAYSALCCELHSFELAGAEGLEPPSSVLETDSLAIELTPLHLSSAARDFTHTLRLFSFLCGPFSCGIADKTC